MISAAGGIIFPSLVSFHDFIWIWPWNLSRPYVIVSLHAWRSFNYRLLTSAVIQDSSWANVSFRRVLLHRDSESDIAPFWPYHTKRLLPLKKSVIYWSTSHSLDLALGILPRIHILLLLLSFPRHDFIEMRQHFGMCLRDVKHLFFFLLKKKSNFGKSRPANLAKMELITVPIRFRPWARSFSLPYHNWPGHSLHFVNTPL